MDLQVIPQSIDICETVFDGFDEQPVDCDFVLPEYYPDIAAVLKCTLKPMIQSRQFSGDRVTVDGVVCVHVLYLDEGRRCVHSCEFTKPFSGGFAVRVDGREPMMTITAKADYVNCRATSPRRLDVHGAFSVRLKLCCQNGIEVVSAMDGDGVYTRCLDATYSIPVASSDKTFTISEVLELGQGKPSAEHLVSSEAVTLLNDCKVLANKLIVKGDLILRCLYVSNAETGELQRSYHEIPFSQIVDAEGLSEEDLCDVRLDVVAEDVHIGTNQNGETRLLEMAVKLAASIQGYRCASIEVVNDAYSTKCPLRLETSQIDTECLKYIRHTSSTVRETLELPEGGVAEILDVRCDVQPISETCAQGRSRMEGRLTIGMLARDEGGVVSYYERPQEFVLEFDDECDRVAFEVGVIGVDHTAIGSSQVEIRTELFVKRRCYSTGSCSAVTRVSADGADPYPVGTAAVKLYYATAGESLWEIAKNCHTSMQAVLEENAVGGDVLTKDTMLLVPLC